MSTIRAYAHQASSRAKGARSRGPVTDASKNRSAGNVTKYVLPRGPLAPLGEYHDEFAATHADSTSDWDPRDAQECGQVIEPVTSMWRRYEGY
jgi:hypothetical protein